MDTSTLPHDPWALLGVVVLALVPTLSTLLGSRKVRKHTDTATARQTRAILSAVDDVSDRLNVVAYRVDEHIKRPGHSAAGDADPPPPIAITRRRRGGGTT